MSLRPDTPLLSLRGNSRCVGTQPLPRRSARSLASHVGASCKSRCLPLPSSPLLQSLHPIAREAWDSIHQIYGARCFETPLLPAPWLAEPAQAASVTLKAEWQQASGSYRARGAAHKMSALADEALQRGVVAAGSVNHTLAVLHAARVLGAARGIDVPVRLFLPGSASPGWADKLREQGGSVEVGGSEEEAEAAARAAAAQGASFLAARNDAAVAGGLGSLAIELLMQLPRGRLDAGAPRALVLVLHWPRACMRLRGHGAACSRS